MVKYTRAERGKPNYRGNIHDSSRCAILGSSTLLSHSFLLLLSHISTEEKLNKESVVDKTYLDPTV